MKMNKNNIYLVAQYAMKPKPHVNTSQAGWMKNPDNIRWDEQMIIVSRLKTRELSAQVILNLTEGTVQRNTFQTGKTFDEIFRYFLENYPEHVAKAMSMANPAYLAETAEQIKNEMGIADETVDNAIQDAEILSETVQA
jgi:hypothetical protein